MENVGFDAHCKGGSCWMSGMPDGIGVFTASSCAYDAAEWLTAIAASEQADRYFGMFYVEETA